MRKAEARWLEAAHAKDWLGVHVTIDMGGQARFGPDVEWIERIPLSETRGYVQHVLENAVVYEAMHPQRALMPGPNPLSRFLGKRTPG